MAEGSSDIDTPGDSFSALLGSGAKDEKYQAANRVLEEVQRRPGTDTSEAQAVRAATWQDCHRALGNICRLVPVGCPHILTVDNRGDDRYQSATAMRLLHDLSAEGAARPIVASGLIEDGNSAMLAVRAVSTALGIIGNDLSSARCPLRRCAAGSVPMQMWIDTARTPLQASIHESL